ncbi:hypothetical protein BH20ACT6_BH20ACT6_09590 [soil metagenome]
MAEVCAVAAGTGQEGARRYLSVPGQLSRGRHEAVEQLRETANARWADEVTAWLDRCQEVRTVRHQIVHSVHVIEHTLPRIDLTKPPEPATQDAVRGETWLYPRGDTEWQLTDELVTRFMAKCGTAQVLGHELRQRLLSQ